jgi:excisionase family DNA binding protein
VGLGAALFVHLTHYQQNRQDRHHMWRGCNTLTSGMSGEPELLTANEAAERLRVSGDTVRRWIRLDILPAVRLPSGQVRIRREDVERLLQRSEP